MIIGSNKNKYVTGLDFGSVQANSWMNVDNGMNSLYDPGKDQAAAIQRRKMSEFGLLSTSAPTDSNTTDAANADMLSTSPSTPSKAKSLFADDNIDGF